MVVRVKDMHMVHGKPEASLLKETLDTERAARRIRSTKQVLSISPRTKSMLIVFPATVSLNAFSLVFR